MLAPLSSAVLRTGGLFVQVFHSPQGQVAESSRGAPRPLELRAVAQLPTSGFLSDGHGPGVLEVPGLHPRLHCVPPAPGLGGQ